MNEMFSFVCISTNLDPISNTANEFDYHNQTEPGSSRRSHLESHLAGGKIRKKRID